MPLSTTDFTDVQVESEVASVMSYYPSVERVFDTLVPQYIVGIVYATMVQAYASEQSARMKHLDRANRNGREMLDNYTSELNTERQSEVNSDCLLYTSWPEKAAILSISSRGAKQSPSISISYNSRSRSSADWRMPSVLPFILFSLMNPPV